MPPNIFTFATSELSQDAMFCWWLSWADATYAATNPKMHQVGRDFLEAIYRAAGRQPPVVSAIKILRQCNRIDVLCIVNGTTAILVEDKVGAKQHDNQLLRYKETVAALGFANADIIPVYIQTGDQSDYSEVRKHGYSVLERRQILGILKDENGKAACASSEMLADYADYLCKVEDDVQSYRIKPLSHWTGGAWKGFFSHLQSILGDGQWNYVANPAGGFLGYYWLFLGNQECEQYLQLEEGKLCFKINVIGAENRQRLREYWHRKIVSKGVEFGVKIVRPGRFGLGEYMTVAVFDGDYRITNECGLLDMEATVKNIHSAETVLKACAE